MWSIQWGYGTVVVFVVDVVVGLGYSQTLMCVLVS